MKTNTPISLTSARIMKVAGITISMVSLVGRFENVMKLFTHVNIVDLPASDLGESMLRLAVLRLWFARWGAAIGMSGNVTHLKQLGDEVQNFEDISKARDLLDQIASRFEDLANITRDHEVEARANQAPNDDSRDQATLIDRMRRIWKSYRCKPDTLKKAKWLFIFERIRHRSFRRQCKLSEAQVTWVMDEKDKLKELNHDLSDMMRQLHDLFPEFLARRKELYEREARWLLRQDWLTPSLLYSLKCATVGFDVVLCDAIVKQESRIATGEP